MILDAEAGITDLEDLTEEWEALFRQDESATPFCSPGFTLAWWRHFGADAEPWFVTVRQDDRLVGLASLCRRAAGPFRALQVTGPPVADYWDVLAVPQLAGAVREAVARALLDRSRDWDAFSLRRLPPESPTADALRAAGLTLLARSPEPYSAIELPESFDAYLARLPTSRRTNLRRRLRHLDDGDLELVHLGDPRELPRAVRQWHELRLRQWEATGNRLLDIQTTESFRAFIEDVACALVPSGRCLVWEFRRHGRLVGSYVNFADRCTFYGFLGGYDVEAAGLGVGKIAVAHAIRSSIEQGRRRYDFMLGAENYKRWYGAVEKESRPYLVHTSALRSRAAVAAGAIRSGVRVLRASA